MLTASQNRQQNLEAIPLFKEGIVCNRVNTYPRITVVTANFNKAEFLETTILSVLNQNYPNLEYIIIDGASTDGSVDIIRKYEKYLAYWISEEDKGMTDALVKGFNRATGDIYAWLNSDDAYTVGTLQFVSEFFSSRGFDLLYGDMYLTNKQFSITGISKSYSVNYRIYNFQATTLNQPACFWSATAFKNAGGLNVNFELAMDGDLFSRILALPGIKSYRTNRILAKFRIHSGQSPSWASSKDRQMEELHLIRSRETYSILFRLLYRMKLFRVYARLLRMFSLG